MSERAREVEPIKLDKDVRLRQADLEAKKADQAALEALRAALPPGRVVKWKHGEHWRMGDVIEVLGFQYQGAQVRVRSIKSGKRFDVGAYSILEAL